MVRSSPLAATVVDALRAQRRQSLEMKLLAGQKWQEHDFVFTSNRGTPLREAHVLERFHRVLDQAGLERRRMHDLRHTFATRLFALGTHPRVVQDMLGHSRIGITMDTYTASVPEAVRAASEMLNREFEGRSDEASA